MNSWQLLGLDPTSDTQAIRRAYALKIRTYRPDTHPKEFSAIRTAYETALREAAWYAEEEAEEATEDVDADNDNEVATSVKSTEVLEDSRPNPEILVFSSQDSINSPIDQNHQTPAALAPSLPPIEELVLPESSQAPTPQAAEVTFSVDKAINRLDELHTQGDVAALLACFAQQQQELADASIDLRMDYAEALAYFCAHSQQLAPELLFQAAATLQWRAQSQGGRAHHAGLGLHEVTDNPVVNQRLANRMDMADIGIAAAYFSPNSLLNAQLRSENPPPRRWAWGVDWQHCQRFLLGLQQECTSRHMPPPAHWRFPPGKNSVLHQFGLILSTDVLLGLFAGIPFGLWLDKLLERPSDFSFLLCWGVGCLFASAVPSLSRHIFTRTPSWLRCYFPSTGLKQYFGGLLALMLALGMSAIAEESHNFLPFAVFAYLLHAPCALFVAACWGTLAWRGILLGETLIYVSFMHVWRTWSASLAFPLAQKTGSLTPRHLQPPRFASWRERWGVFWLLWRKGWHVYVRNPQDISPKLHDRRPPPSNASSTSGGINWWTWLIILWFLGTLARMIGK